MRIRTTILCITALHCATLAAQDVMTIDLKKASGGGGIVLASPGQVATAETKRQILLPAFEKVCHVAADEDFLRWIGASNRLFPWIGNNSLTDVFKPRSPKPPTVSAPNRRAFLMLFKLKDGRYMVLMPLSGDDSVSWLETGKDGTLTVDYGSLGTQRVPANSKVPLLSWCASDNPFEALSRNWKQLQDAGIARGRLRDQRIYPESLSYLGWCTWEQYHKKISEKVLLDAFDQIDRSDVPVRWLLIDDGHQTDKDGRIVSLDPAKQAFPRGWQPLIARKREDKVKWIGIWHTLLVHWNNVDKDHQMPFLAPYIMPKPKIPGAERLDSGGLAGISLIPKDNLADSEKFYTAFMGAVKAQGFDFLKTDNVSRSTIEYYGTRNAAAAQVNNLRSLERATADLGMGLMNCSAQNTICLMNASDSATMRTSPDYKKMNLATSKSQILQSVFNVCWLGQSLWPDHDMFHSSDKEVAATMAVTKALSGGPIYLSDAPHSFNREIVMPLCYNDGLLLRPVAPGVPTPDSLFSDALYSLDPYKVVAPLNNQACAIVAYNLNLRNDTSVTGVISPEDYAHASAMIQPYKGLWTLPEEGAVLYDWSAKKSVKLGKEGHRFQIKGFGHKLFLVVPVRQGWAVIGRPDKYLSPATVEIVETTKKSITFKILHEAARILLYSGEGVPTSALMTFKALGDGFYEATPDKSMIVGSIVRVNR